MIIGIVLLIILAFIIGLYLIYRYAFGVNSRRLAADDEVPHADRYEEYAKYVHDRIQVIQAVPFEKMMITARDGVKLYGRYYHRADEAPVVLMFHGYRSSSLRDGMGAFRFTEECGYNILMVDQRAHRESGGRSITFGVKERYDCLDWIAHLKATLGEDTKMILIGLSMGASTVLMAAGLELPENVQGIIADCGYSTPKDILSEVIKKMRLPVAPVYFLVRLSGIIFGGFDVESASAKEALKHCKVPVLLIHGEADDFVPCEMSKANYEACGSEKELFLVPGAGHGMSYMTDTEGYVERFKGFLQKYFAE